MGKRVIALLCVLVMVATLFTACGGKTKTVNKVKVELQTYQDQLSGRYVSILLVTNKTGDDCSLELTTTLLDANGAPVEDVKTGSVDAFVDGTTVVKYYSTEAPVEDFSCNAVVSPLEAVPVDKDLKVKVEKNNGIATFTVENKGTNTAEEPDWYAIFYKSGKPVYIDSGELNGDLMPGATLGDMSSCQLPFDDVEVYVHSQGKI